MSGSTTGHERAWCQLGALLAVMLVAGCAPSPPAAPYEAQIQREGVDRGILPLIDPDKRRIGFMTQAGDVLIEPAYQGVGYFSEGLAPVRLGEKWGYVDKKGQLVLAIRYAYAHPFRDGLALVRLGEPSADEQWAFIDHRGAIAIGPDVLEDYALVDFFSEGLAPVVPRGSDYWGYLDRAGELAIDDDWEGVSPFAGGVAYVFTDGNHKSGFIDRRGGFVSAPRPQKAGAFSEGRALTSRCAGDRFCEYRDYGYVDEQGKLVIPFRPYVDAYEFSYGYAKVKVGKRGLPETHRRGYIDRTGRYLIEPEFIRATSFVYGLAVAERLRPDRYGDTFLIDTRGNRLLIDRAEDVLSLYFSEQPTLME